MPFGYYDSPPVYSAPPRPKEYAAAPAPPPRRAAPPAERPAPRVERPAPPPPLREPEVVRVSLPGPDELGITVREELGLPSPDELGINPK